MTNAPWYLIPVIVSQTMMCAFLCTLHNVSSACSYIIHPNTFKYCIWILCNNPKADSKPCLMGVSNVNHFHGEVVSGHCVLRDPIYATCVGSKTEVPPTKFVFFSVEPAHVASKFHPSMNHNHSWTMIHSDLTYLTLKRNVISPSVDTKSPLPMASHGPLATHGSSHHRPPHPGSQ